MADYNFAMEKKRAFVEGRDGRQISFIVSCYFTYDVFSLICIVIALISVFLLFAPGEIWFKILFPVAFSIPPLIRTILTVRLSKALKNKPSVTVRLEKPYAKVVRTWQGGDVYHLRGLRINGLSNGRLVSYFEYPLRGSEKTFEEKARTINGSATYEFRVISGTRCVDNFYAPKSKTKGAKKSLALVNRVTGKTKRFSYEPIPVSKEDIVTFLELFSGYEELFFSGPDKKYALVTLSTSGEPENRWVSVDKEAIDDPVKAVDLLAGEGYCNEGGAFLLLSIMDGNDPNGFFAELELIRS